MFSQACVENSVNEWGEGGGMPACTEQGGLPLVGGGVHPPADTPQLHRMVRILLEGILVFKYIYSSRERVFMSNACF